MQPPLQLIEQLVDQLPVQLLVKLREQGYPKVQIRQTVAADMFERYGIRPEDLGYAPVKESLGPMGRVVPIPKAIKAPRLKG